MAKRSYVRVVLQNVFGHLWELACVNLHVVSNRGLQSRPSMRNLTNEMQKPSGEISKSLSHKSRSFEMTLFIFFAYRKGDRGSLGSPLFFLHFFCSPKRNEAKKRALSQKAFLQLTLQNQGQWPELPTGIRQFLTAIVPYAAAKGLTFKGVLDQKSGYSLMSPLFLEILRNLHLKNIRLYVLGCPKAVFFTCVGNQGKTSGRRSERSGA